MVNILEICLTELINKKNLLENELERIVNSNTIETDVKFNKSLSLIEEISNLYKSIELVNTYITKNNDNLKN
jgi:hypothetical protein